MSGPHSPTYPTISVAPASPGVLGFNIGDQLRLSLSNFGTPEILPEDIVYDVNKDLLGRGAYGAVFRARVRGYEVAVKILYQQHQLSAEALEQFQKEVGILSANSHPNVVRLMGACTIPGKLQIVTERCYGDVESLLYDSAYKGTLFDRLKIAKDTASGMNWLHEATHTIHGDLKPANLLLDRHAQVKIADFGFGQIKKHIIVEKTVQGSLMWMAPEKIMQHPFGKQIDVFSFGIILWQIITRKKPYEGIKFASVQDFCGSVCTNGLRPHLSDVSSPNLRDLLERCWHHDPNQRYSFEEIIKRLNYELIDSIITSNGAAAFWKDQVILADQLLEYTEALWGQFEVALRESLNNNLLDLSRLKILLAEKKTMAGREIEYVSIDRFSLVVKWLGPFYTSNYGPSIITQFNDLVQLEWFHVDISKETADMYLTNRPHGTFLIRFSSDPSEKYPFTLSTTQAHSKLARWDLLGVQTKDGQYANLVAFVEAHRARLVHACPKAGANPYIEF